MTDLPPQVSTADAFLPESRPFEEHYDLGHFLGEGTYAQVWECTARETGARYACKAVSKASLGTFRVREGLETEVALLRSFQGLHTCGVPGLLQFKEVTETQDDVFIITELCEGGSLFDIITSKGPLPEDSAKAVFQQLLETVAFCHSRGILHRDIKPENILFAGPAGDLHSGAPLSLNSRRPGQLKLADFGLAVVIQPGATVQGFEGNLWYTAPEILQRKEYALKADVWSLGVILYFMLTGHLPFPGESQQEMYRAAFEGRVCWEKGKWEDRGVSPGAKRFIRKMLQPWQSWRSTAQELLHHPWVAAWGAQAPHSAPCAVQSPCPERPGTSLFKLWGLVR